MVSDDELYNSMFHNVKLVDYMGRERITYVSLYASPYDSDSDKGYSGIAVDDGIFPDFLFQDNIESIEILDDD